MEGRKKVYLTYSFSTRAGTNTLTELSEEDKENLRLGTIQVREVLQESAARITDKEIQESLWHTYYDVNKTVGFLLNKIEAKIKKEQKAAGKKATGGFGISSSSSHLVGAGGDLGTSGGGFMFYLCIRSRLSEY